MATPLLAIPNQTLGSARYVVPWKTRKEFLQIYSDVFSKDEELQIKAVKRITTWKSRAGSKISVAIENTGALLENIINHKKASREHQINEKESFLRAGYSLAITRFVNHVTEKGQNKSTAQPIHTLAREYRIPEWIVRIRHDATHNALPGLDLLATAASWALQYLKKEFWDYQTHESSVFKRSGKRRVYFNLKKKVRDGFRNFQNLRSKSLKSEEVDKNAATNNLVRQLKEYMKGNRYYFIQCLLEDGALIPTTKQLEEDFGVERTDMMSQPCPSVPQPLVAFWQPVITMLYNTGAVAVLAKVAIFSLSDEECLRNYLLAAWLAFLLTYSPVPEDTNKKSNLTKAKKRLLLPSPVFQARNVLLAVCLDKVNKFTIHLLQYLMDRGELGDEAYQQLSELLRITPLLVESCHSNSTGDDEPEEENIYTVEDIKEASFSQEAECPSPTQHPPLEDVQASVNREEIAWKICSDVLDWSKVPLGFIPPCPPLSNEDDEGEDEDEEEEEDDRRTSDEEDDRNRNEGEEEEAGSSTRGVRREWKKMQRKRPVEDKEDGLNVERSSPKRSTYVVNDTELL